MDRVISLAHTVSLDDYLETIGKQALADGLDVDKDTDVKIVMNNLASQPTITVYIGWFTFSIALRNGAIGHPNKDKTWTLAKNECWSDFKRGDVLLSLDRFAHELLNVWTAS